jgi:hypothetical protein
MKAISSILFLVAVFSLFNFDNSYAQDSGEKVYWMSTIEVPLGKLEAYHSFNRRELMPLMIEHGYNPVATWQTIVGEIEEVIFVAEFENMQAYNTARVSLLGSDDWQTASNKFNSLTKGISTRFLRAAPYANLQ